jgi:hypothetical protein
MILRSAAALRPAKSRKFDRATRDIGTKLIIKSSENPKFFKITTYNPASNEPHHNDQ